MIVNEYIWIESPLLSSYFDSVVSQDLNLIYTYMLFPKSVKPPDGCCWILGVIFIIPHPVYVLFLVYILQLV